MSRLLWAASTWLAVSGLVRFGMSAGLARLAEAVKP